MLRKGSLDILASGELCKMVAGRFVTVMVLASGSLGTVPAQAASDLHREVLPNGLTILARQSASTGIVAVEVLIRMGPRFESDAEAGLSALTQNCLLKGTRTRSATQISLEIESLGARIAASSGSDHGLVSLLATSAVLDRALEVLFDVLTDASFPEAELALERTLLIEEIKARRDDPLSSAFELFQEAFYGAHPYHKPRSGYENTLNKLDRERVVKCYESFYVPGNMVITAVGNFDLYGFLKKVRERLGTLEKRPLPSETAVPAGDDSRKKSEVKASRDVDRAWLVVGYPAPSLSSPDYPAVEVLDCIIGGSMHSHLFIELRERQGLAYQVGSLYAARTGPGFLAAYAATDRRQFETVRDKIRSSLSGIAENGVNEDELERAKQYLKGTFVMKQEGTSAQAEMLGLFELEGLGWQFVERYPQLVSSVTRDNVKTAARKYLNRHTVAAVLPGVAKE